MRCADLSLSCNIDGCALYKVVLLLIAFIDVSYGFVPLWR